ncbi:MAG: hypothetical protein ACRCZB_05065 [Bacteroidales bacterium]
MNELCRDDIDDVDDDRREELMHKTREVVYKTASNMISSTVNCSMTRKALTDAITSPLIESVNANHFTKRLMPEYYSSFRLRLYKLMESSYLSARQAYLDNICEFSAVPEWKEYKDICDYVLSYWLSEITMSVMTSCERKLTVYNRFLDHFKFSMRYRKITEDRIKRNKNYIAELKELNSRLKQEIK